MKKYTIEFGVRGGQWTEIHPINSRKLARKMARDLVRVFTNDLAGDFNMVGRPDCPRETWSNSTHFVAVTVLDNVPRGGACAQLWKKERESC